MTAATTPEFVPAGASSPSPPAGTRPSTPVPAPGVDQATPAGSGSAAAAAGVATPLDNVSDEWRRRNRVDEPFSPEVDAAVRRILQAPLPPQERAS